MSPQWHAWMPQQYQTAINISVCSQCLYFSHHALVKKFLSSTGPQAVFLVALFQGKADFELHDHWVWCSPLVEFHVFVYFLESPLSSPPDIHLNNPKHFQISSSTEAPPLLTFTDSILTPLLCKCGNRDLETLDPSKFRLQNWIWHPDPPFPSPRYQHTHLEFSAAFNVSGELMSLH